MRLTNTHLLYYGIKNARSPHSVTKHNVMIKELCNEVPAVGRVRYVQVVYLDTESESLPNYRIVRCD